VTWKWINGIRGEGKVTVEIGLRLIMVSRNFDRNETLEVRKYRKETKLAATTFPVAKLLSRYQIENQGYQTRDI